MKIEYIQPSLPFNEMKLEDEIHQKKFVNESAKLAVNMIFTYNWLNQRVTAFLKTFGITPQQFNILRILRGMSGTPASVKLLRERMLDKMSDASRIVEKLRIKGLIERSVNSVDRRACDVVITQKGLDLLSKIDIEINLFDRLFDQLDENDKKNVNELLDRLRG
jgi:DNA-binding MarR family transcriptional regulator